LSKLEVVDGRSEGRIVACRPRDGIRDSGLHFVARDDLPALIRGCEVIVEALGGKVRRVSVKERLGNTAIADFIRTVKAATFAFNKEGYAVLTITTPIGEEMEHEFEDVVWVGDYETDESFFSLNTPMPENSRRLTNVFADQGFANESK
jgi:hypothetical protein